MYLILRLLIITFLFSIPLTAIQASKNRQFITVGTASISGVYYPVGGAICKLVNRVNQEIQCSVQSTPGTIYNINALRNNDIDIGIAQADSEYNSYYGKGIFTQQTPNQSLRTLFLIHHDVFTVLTRKDSKIRTLDDIKNKRVNIGSPGTGVRDTIQQLMGIKGWSKSDFKLASELKSSEQAQALCDNKIDVMIDVIGHPSGSIQEASATCETTIIPVDDELIEKLKAEHPYYDNYTIPGGMYIGNDEEVNTFAVRTSVLSSDQVDQEIIYDVVKATFQGFKQLKGLHPVFAHLTKEKMVGVNTAPLHKGAIKYYKEVGLLK